MTPPAFWQHGGGDGLPRLLQPLAWAMARVAAARVGRDGYHADARVICCGNASVGGTGKTTLALHILHRLRAQGKSVASLSRGHGGRAWPRPHLVDLSQDSARDVGDEALLLARAAPCYVGADRAAAARLAVMAGATHLVMDDGLQNPGLHKDISFLVIDGGQGFGNGRVMPAGPLREPVAAAAKRVGAAILIGDDQAQACAQLPPGLPVLRADLVPGAEIETLRGQDILAFAGIGRPEKFFAMLRAAGLRLVETRAFRDHHAYGAADIAALRARADGLSATLVCTPKDQVKLPAGLAIAVGVDLRFGPDFDRYLP